MLGRRYPGEDSGAIGLTAGSGGYGISVSASVNAGKGRENGNGLTHTETTLTAGNGLSLNAGRDTTLTGAQVRGDSVKVDTGRNLTLTSEQDSDRYDSKQQNASAGGSFTFGSMTGSASVNLSQDKMHSNWQSVAEQTGIFAGNGGFDVTAGEHTRLNGAVISSTATADKNRLDTGTLGFSNIENHADYKTGHQSVGMSTGGSIGSQFEGNMANGLLAGLNGSGSASSVTKAAVSDGTLIIRDKAKQTQDVADLNRDAAGANPGLDKIFDKDKEQRRMETAQLLAEIGSQAGDIARTQGEIAATRAATEKMKNISPDQKKDAEAQWRKANPGQEPTAADITGQVYQTLYNREMLAGGMGTGGSVQQGISAATAAIQGLAGGNIAQAVSGAAAPYLAEQIHKLTTTKGPDGKEVVNVQANLIAHAVVGAVTSYASGNPALAGASGAAMGEYIAQQMYPGVKREDLSEEQRQTISALGTLAAGLAGGVAGDSTGGAVAGAQAGKNALENNNLLLPRPMLVPVPGLPLSPGDKVVQDANNKIASELDKTLKGSGTEADTPPITDGRAIVEARDEAAKSRDPNVAHNQQYQDGSSNKTETVPVNDDLTGGKLVNPFHDENKGTSLVTPDRSGEQAPGNTGNTDGMPDTGGNTTVTPTPEYNKDDLAYSSEKQLGRGSTGRTEPNSLQEKLAIEQAQSNPESGRQLPIPMTDKRWPREDGWVKMAQNINGVEVHYVRNTKTGQVDDFKFK
uniref:hemagglutinin repeat-containing protein n=1 Tax=Enterobacter agglomerans TaxID=549 RepID=UPI0036F25431